MKIMNRIKWQCTVAVNTKKLQIYTFILCSKIINFRKNLSQCICSKISALVPIINLSVLHAMFYCKQAYFSKSLHVAEKKRTSRQVPLKV